MRRRGDDARIIFCVDTDTYAGSFERELCAYMTGILGECEVGEESKKLYEEDGHEPLEDLVDPYVPDDHGCRRPVSIHPTPGWFNDGAGNHYRESGYDEAAVVKKYNQKVEEDAKRSEQVYADKAHGKKEADRIRKECKAKKVKKYPAYNSVAVFLTREPTKEEIEFLKDRASKFVADQRKRSRFSDERFGFKIEGFRLVVEEKVAQERSL